MDRPDRDAELAADLEIAHQRLLQGPRNSEQGCDASHHPLNDQEFEAAVGVLQLIERVRQHQSFRCAVDDMRSTARSDREETGRETHDLDWSPFISALADDCQLPPAGHLPGTSPAVPKSLGRFQICRVLGQGGFGIVFLANDPQLGRQIALKVPRPDAFSLTGQERFIREARAAALLGHPNIVTVYEAGRIGPILFAAFQLVEGPTLAGWLAEQSGRLRLNTAVKIVCILAQAIQHAHSRGIIHRDLKPGNIMLDLPPHETTEDRVASALRITDFGLARVETDHRSLTQSGAILGTPAYMSPEQARGDDQDIGVGTDIYALGAILYELLTGAPPFQRSTYAATIRAIEQEEPRSPRRLRGDVPRDLEAIILKCLEKYPARRYASATELEDDLQRYLDGRAVRARIPSSGERLLRWCQRNPALATTTSVAAGAVVVGLIVSVSQWRSAASQAQRSERNLQRAEQAIDRMLEHAGDSFQGIPQLERLRTDLYTEAISLQTQLLGERPGDAGARLRTAQAYRRLAPMQSRLRDLEAAFASIRRAQELLESIRAPHDDVDPHVRTWEQALCSKIEGDIYRVQRDFTNAANAMNRALSLMATIPRESMTDANLVQYADAYYQLGTIRTFSAEGDSASDSFDKAMAILEQVSAAARESVPYRTLFCDLNVAMGKYFRFEGDSERAADHMRRATDTAQRLIDEHPQRIDLKAKFADSLLNLGILYGEQKQHDEELKLKTRASEVLRSLVDSFPDSIVFLEQWCFALEAKGRALRSLDRGTDACAALRESIQAIQQGVQRFPESPEFTEMLATAFRSLGKTYLDEGDVGQAEAALLPAVEAADRLLAEYPATPEHLHTSSMAYFNLSRLRARQGRLPDALSLLDKGYAQVSEAFAAIPGYRTSVSWFHADYCKLHCRLGNHDRALAAARSIIDLDPSSGPLHLYAAEALATCASEWEQESGSIEMSPRQTYLDLGKQLVNEAIRIGAITGDTAAESQQHTQGSPP